MEQVVISVSNYNELLNSHQTLRNMERGTTRLYKPIPILTNYMDRVKYRLIPDDELDGINDGVSKSLVAHNNLLLKRNKELKEANAKLKGQKQNSYIYLMFIAVAVGIALVVNHLN